MKRRLGRLVVAIVRPFLFLLHPWRVVGRENLPKEGAVILCANHVSNWDPGLLMLCLPRPICFMAKEELFRFKPLGAVLSGLFGAFPVARGKGDTGALDRAQEVLERGEVLGIFPEGTRSRDGRMLRFKSGAALIAARSGACVVPCGIDRRTRPFRRVTISFGAPLTSEELQLAGEAPNLRQATRLMTERVQQLSGQEMAR